jgi:hypothetical protein
MTKPNHKSYARYTAEALNLLFTERAYEDQAEYYEQRTRRNKLSVKQVTALRATLAFFAGLSSASATLLFTFKVRSGCPTFAAIDLAKVVPGAECSVLSAVLIALPIFCIVFPALGAAFHTLSDLYQWERLGTVYETAMANLKSAGAKAPLPSMSNTAYDKLLEIYALNTLAAMRDEATQWGQLIKAPDATTTFIAGRIKTVRGMFMPLTANYSIVVIRAGLCELANFASRPYTIVSTDSERLELPVGLRRRASPESGSHWVRRRSGRSHQASYRLARRV